MNCSCSICCSRLNSSDDIFSTPCGHVFHFPCLSQWLERSKTCPQCREKSVPSKIHRLYFNVSNNDSVVQDSSALQERIDNLKFEIRVRDKDVTDFKSKAVTLQAQQSALRSAVIKLEAEIEQKKSVIYALKDQVKYYKQTHDEGKKYKEQAETLKNRLNQLKGVQTLLLATNDEAEVLISSTDDPNKLATYVSALKRELTVGLNKRKEYRLIIKQLKQDLDKTVQENNSLKEKVTKLNLIEKVVERSEKDNSALTQSLGTIKKSQSRPEPNLDALRKLKSLELPKKQVSLSKFEIGLPLEDNPSEENEENSPRNLRYTVQNLVPDTKRKIKQSNPGKTVSSSSILAKKPRLARDPTALAGPRDEMYASDGLGGFAKIEHFPKTTSSMTTRRAASNAKSRAGQAINNANNQNKIDNFVDLTD